MAKMGRLSIWQPRMTVYLLIFFEVLGIASALHAVMHVRTPQGTIAWAATLVTVPVVAVPAYWVFGRNKFKGYVHARQNELEAINDVIREANTEIISADAVDDWRSSNITGAERLARVPLTGGNSVKLLVDGEATFQSIFDGIDAATEYLLLQFYIVHDDQLGQDLKDRLIAKAQDGVRVHFLYDEIGSIGLPGSYTDALRDGGVDIRPFHSRKGSGNRFQLNFRNHRKTVIADGRIAWIGGHNVGDEYLGRDESIGRWRDTHMRLEGPAVIGAQIAFVEDWRWATEQSIADLNWNPHTDTQGDARALVIASGPADPMETASLMYTQAINGANNRLWIASPYFVPDDAIVQSLQLAALRGVDVRILIPEKTDSTLVTLAAYAFFTEIKAAGVDVYRYQDGFLHQKTMLIDDNVATVGTANFDNRSFRLNFEITSVVIDEAFAEDVERMFEADFANARLMQVDEYEQKPYWFKLAVRAARLAAPVL